MKWSIVDGDLDAKNDIANSALNRVSSYEHLSSDIYDQARTSQDRLGASANGTWLCLTDYRLRYLKQSSEELPLRKG